MSDKYRKCAKCGSSAVQNPELIFHKFPRAGKSENYLRVQLWAEYCYPGKKFIPETLKNMYRSHKILCSKHFDRSAYVDDTMKKLNSNALPTMISDAPLILGPSQQAQVLDSVAVPVSKIETVSKSAGYNKCKKYINKIYRLKKSISDMRRAEGKTKFLEALTESSNLKKLHQRLKPAFSLLLQSQIKNAPRKLNGRRWSLSHKILALAIYKKSNAAYRLLRRLFCLPSPGTLRNLLNNVPLPCGVNQKVMANLKDITKGQETDNLCILLFDEMSLKKNLVYNPKTDLIDGYQDHGLQGRSNKIASHALVFMLVGLRKRWKQPVAHYFSGDSVTADRLQALIKEVLAQCHANNLNVVATVCDMDGVNIRALNALGSTVEAPYFLFEKNEVITILDPPHLLKCFRNNFLKHDIECPQNFAINGTSGIAKWKHIEEFYKKDKSNPNFVFAPALTEQHLRPNGKQKMRVKLAAQVLSHSVAAGMLAKVATCEIPSEAIMTATLVKKIDSIFDSLNAESADLKRGKQYSTNLTKKTDHLKLFDEIKKMFLNIKFIGARSPPPSLNGWIRTINAVERLWYNLNKKNVYSLSTRRLNQDPLENLFGCIRINCGSNPNPNTQQFIAGLKTSIITNMRYKSVHKNCEDDANTLLTNMKTYLKTNHKFEASLSTTVELINSFDISESELEDSSEIQACAYVCGFIFKKLKNNQCTECKNIMLAREIDSTHIFNEFKEYNENKASLQYVNKRFITCVESCATFINDFLKKYSSTTTISKKLREKINNLLSFSWLDGCQQHKHENISQILNSVLAITIKRFCILNNRMFAKEASSNALKRKIAILKHQ